MNDTPTCMFLPDGTEQWCMHGKIHREDGPAVIYPHGKKEWRLNGKLHRENGPAVIYPDGREEWYLNGRAVARPRGEAQ